jgi:hypothetical protein
MESEPSFNIGHQKQKSSKIPGQFMTIMGIALVTWFIFDMISVSQGYRVPYLDDIASTARLVIGIVAILGGMFAWKWDDIGTTMQ